MLVDGVVVFANGVESYILYMIVDVNIYIYMIVCIIVFLHGICKEFDEVQ